MEKYEKRVEIFEENKKKAFAWIYATYCGKEMKNRLQENPDFNKDVYNNPIKLLEEIQMCMNQPRRGQYHHVKFYEAMKKFLLMCQKDEEELSEFGQRLRQEMKLIGSLFGTNILSDGIKTTKEYKDLSDKKEKELMLKREWKHLQL